MKRIGVISDSHGDEGHVQQALMKLEAGGHIDTLIHCGDGALDAERYSCSILQTLSVKGNCDFWTGGLEDERLISIGGVRFFITHGHRYGVKNGLDMIADCGAAKGAQIICFGHTHQPLIESRGGVLLINPGACHSTGRCALITIDEKMRFDAQLL